MIKTLIQSAAAIAMALALVVSASAIGAAQAHHSTAHSIGTPPPSTGR
jgi:hypothetical protein